MIIKPFQFISLLTILILSSCNLGVDFGGFFSSYSDPDSRFDEKDELSMHSDPQTLQTIPLINGKLSYSFSIISDIHVKDNKAVHLEQFVQDLLIPEDRFILDCGDSSQSGTADQLETYKTILNISGLPWFAAIGNHDLYFEGWKNYREIIGRSIYSFQVGSPGYPGSLFAIVLDSANGTLGGKQLNWLKETLEMQKGLWDHLIVMTHSQFFSTGLNSVVQFTDTDEIYALMYLFRTYGVDYVFMGHNHKWDKRTINGVNYISLDPLIKGNSEDSYIRVSVEGSDISFERIMIPPI